MQAASPRKLLVETRRRGWLVLLVAMLASLVAWGVAQALPRSATAEAVLVVRVDGPLAAQPDASTKLAATYATVIPLDAALQDAVDSARRGQSDESFTASNDANTAVLRVRYKAGHAGAARAGAALVAHLISSAHPASDSIAPNSVAIVRLPATATRAGGSPTELAILGAALGVLLGLLLVAFWRARDPRVDELRELRAQLACPCFGVGGGTAGAQPLVEALASSEAQTAVVLPVGAREQRAAEALCSRLNDVIGAERAVCAPPPGSAEAGELLAAAADATILVVTPGAPVAALAEALDLLTRCGVAPAYAVLAMRGEDAPQLVDSGERVGATG